MKGFVVVVSRVSLTSRCPRTINFILYQKTKKKTSQRVTAISIHLRVSRLSSEILSKRFRLSVAGRELAAHVLAIVAKLR